MPSSFFIHPLTGKRTEYQYLTLPGRHAFDGYFSHKVNERKLRQKYFIPAIQAGSVFIDIGSAYGSWSIPAAMIGAQVYAVDPRPEVCQQLADSMALNGLQGNSVIINAAAANKVTEAGYEMCDSGSTSTTTLQGQSHVHCKSHSMVPTITVDWLVSEYSIQKVDFIKVDAEGVELEVLQGAADTIRRFTPNMIIECHLMHDDKMVQKILGFVDSLTDYEAYSDILKGHFGSFSSQRPHLIFIRKTI